MLHKKEEENVYRRSVKKARGTREVRKWVIQSKVDGKEDNVEEQTSRNERERGGRKRARINGKINELKSRRSDGWMVQAGNRKI